MYKTGIGIDIHKLVEDRDLILAGVKIDYNLGLLGHSDADVLTHSIMDAILGALSLGDIGRHFPDSDEKYKDISSMLLLEEVVKMMEEKSYTLVNIDSTIELEKPKIAPYIESMRLNLAKTLNISKDRINIKGTTCEGLGYIGEGRGARATSCVLLKKIDFE